MKQILISNNENISDANAVLVAPIALNIRTEIAKESIPIMSKEEPANVVISIDSQVVKNSVIAVSKSRLCCTRINLISINVIFQGKIAREPIPVTSKEELSSLQTEIAEESIQTMCTDSPSHSATVALAEIATINKFKSDTKVKV